MGAITTKALVPAIVVAALFAAIADGSGAAPRSFPGKNGVLVFDAVDNTNSTVQIFRVSAGGTGLKQLTTTKGMVWNEDPVLSANGQTIYFDSLDRATTRPSHIYRMNQNGTGRRLADKASAPTHVWPSVNRSGTSLAVVQYGKSGRAMIATMKTSGAHRKVVAKATRLQGNGSPEYAPNNGRIAFYRVTYKRARTVSQNPTFSSGRTGATSTLPRTALRSSSLPPGRPTAAGSSPSAVSARSSR